MINIYEKTFLSFFKEKKFVGKIEIVSDGKRHIFGSDQKDMKAVEIQVLNKNFFKRIIFYGDIGLGEAFFLREFDTKDLKALLWWFVRNQEQLPSFRDKKLSYYFFEWAKLLTKLSLKKNKNTKDGSKKNIASHYDVSNEFYALWLDETMTYSSAMFKGGTILKEAQENKYRSICEKLDLGSKDHVLEIGSGWGGFAIYATTNYGCRVTTVTISNEQFALAKKRIRDAGLSEKIDIKIQDYRDLAGLYDKIVSIEMIEAVGHEYIPFFADKCRSVLKSGGKMCLQCITYPDEFFETHLKNPNYIKKYIFPGGELISLASLKKEVEKDGLMNFSSVERIGLDYAQTLKIWRDNFISKKGEIMALGFSLEFFRKWLYYFVYCEVGFESGYIDDVQVLVDKK